jgi:hypothetical protein
MSVNEGVQPAPPTLSDHMRVRFKGILDTAAGFLLRLGLKPNTITLLGLAGNIVGVVFGGAASWRAACWSCRGPIDALTARWRACAASRATSAPSLIRSQTGTRSSSSTRRW